ncbi:hypothetical protein CPB97_008180, partial [Podila verticillata]
SSISRAASRARVNKTECIYLSVLCEEIHRRLDSGELGSPTEPELLPLVITLGECRKFITKFTGLGYLISLIRSADIPQIFALHEKNLKMWAPSFDQKLSKKELTKGELEAIRFEETVSANQVRITEVPILLRDLLEFGDEVGQFPFGTIYKGTYRGKPVYIRKVADHFKNVHLDYIGDSIRLSRCLMDCNNVLRALGICEGRTIVTETTALGPLRDIPNLTVRQKVVIARKVADALIAIHGVLIDKKSHEPVIHRDIRAANILIDKVEGEDDNLVPKITGFEMCKQRNLNYFMK